MESALASMILITVMLFATLTLTQTVMASQDALAATQQAQEERWRDQARTTLNAAAPLPRVLVRSWSLPCATLAAPNCQTLQSGT